MRQTFLLSVLFHSCKITFLICPDEQEDESMETTGKVERFNRYNRTLGAKNPK